MVHFEVEWRGVPVKQVVSGSFWVVSDDYSEAVATKVFCKKGVLRNFVEFTGKHLCQSLFLNKVAGLRLAGDIWCFQVVCCFISYTNFTTYRRVISLLCSWTHVIDWGHLIFFFQSKTARKRLLLFCRQPSENK